MGFFDNIKEQTGMGEVKRHPVDQFFFELCPKLSFQERLYGYLACLTIGFILNIGSWARLVDLFYGNPDPFVIFFTVGNIISVLGSFFLNGPYAQTVKMIGPQMRCATIAYLISMVMTFFVCYYKGIDDGAERVGLVILLIIVQYICMIWWIICSIWFVKQFVLACLRGYCKEKCPTCAKYGKCVCDTLEDAKESTGNAISSTFGSGDRGSSSKKPAAGEKKGYFSALYSSSPSEEPKSGDGAGSGKKPMFSNLV